MRDVQIAACRCLHRLMYDIPMHDEGESETVRLGSLLAKHTHPDVREPDRLWHIDWESVLAEVILASAQRSAVEA